MAQHVEIRASTNAQEPLGDADGLKVKVIDTDSGAAVSWDSNYVRLTDSGLVKSGPGVLDEIVVGAAGTTISITVYDNTAGSGTVMFGPYVLVAGARLPGGKFGTGCYITFSGTTGTPNITALYR